MTTARATLLLSAALAFSHCLAHRLKLLLMSVPPPGWKWQPTWVQQAVLHHQNPREHYCRWVILYVWGYSLVAGIHFLVGAANTALKHSKQTPCAAYTVTSYFNCLNISIFNKWLCFLGGMFYFISFLWPLLSYLFWFCIMFLNSQSE